MSTPKKIGFMLCLLAAGCLRASITAPKAEGDSDVSFQEATTALVQAVGQAEKFEVYEGLPHPFEGKDFVENEIQSKATEVLDGDWFYVPAQSMPAEDKASLQRLFGTGLLKAWRGFKFCGGFHGDYAVRFESAGNAYLILFCFGCRESRISRTPLPDQNGQTSPGFRLTTDLAADGVKELAALFKKYLKERPPTPVKQPKVKPPAPPRVPGRF